MLRRPSTASHHVIKSLCPVQVYQQPLETLLNALKAGDANGGGQRLGPYAWVQGRRATSKVTATSGGRLTNRYAWVPGRPTRRACLGVNLPLRVPPCKHYPEEVTLLKMAALILLRYRQRRLLRRNRIFRDRTNPLHKFNDLELFWQFRFRRVDILQMTNELKEELEHLNRKGALPPVFTGRRTALNPCQQ